MLLLLFSFVLCAVSASNVTNHYNKTRFMTKRFFNNFLNVEYLNVPYSFVLDQLKILKEIPSMIDKGINLKERNFTKISLIDNNDVCFDRLGCFNMKRPWRSIQRPIPAPEHPSVINTNFVYFSKNKKTRFYYPELNGSSYADQVTKAKVNVFIVHGFISSSREQWMHDLTKALLKSIDCNVFLVDWEKGAEGCLQYNNAVANIRVVAQEIVLFITRLVTQNKTEVENIHLIGHSLGAHIMSYVCKVLNIQMGKVGRLTAFDPALPLFEGCDARVRLDQSDASFVEVIHTNAFGLGMSGRYGHVDFYMNGGVLQPGCTDTPTYPGRKRSMLSIIKDRGTFMMDYILSCHHTRACDYYVESIENTNCIFWGHPANKSTELGLINGLIESRVFQFESDNKPCTSKTCVPLGLNAVKYSYRGPVNVKTSDSKPFCISEVLSKQKPAKKASWWLRRKSK